PRDDDARRRGVEQSGRAARVEVRGSSHGQGPSRCDRCARGPHGRRRAYVARRPRRTDAGPSRARPVGPGVTKYVFVTGGVVSSLGKGITAASLGRLLKSRGLTVQVQKFDPYINVDPGTMSPF